MSGGASNSEHRHNPRAGCLWTLPGSQRDGVHKRFLRHGSEVSFTGEAPEFDLATFQPVEVKLASALSIVALLCIPALHLSVVVPHDAIVVLLGHDCTMRGTHTLNAFRRSKPSANVCASSKRLMVGCN